MLVLLASLKAGLGPLEALGLACFTAVRTTSTGLSVTWGAGDLVRDQVKFVVKLVMKTRL